MLGPAVFLNPEVRRGRLPGYGRSPHPSSKLDGPAEDVNILRVADGRLIDAGNPRGDGVASHHGVRDSSRFQRGGAVQSLADPFHGPDHPLAGDFAQPDRRHAIAPAP
jgi:hypothetical protein